MTDGGCEQCRIEVAAQCVSVSNYQLALTGGNRPIKMVAILMDG